MRSRIITTLFLFLSLGLAAQNVEFEKENFPADKDGLKTAKDNLKEGDGLYEQGPQYYKEAIVFYEKAQAFNPNNASLNYKLGLCYMSSVYKFKALPFLEKAEKLNPNVAMDLYYHLGTAQHLNMQFDKAMASFSKYQRAIQADPNATRDPYYDLQGKMDDVKMRVDQCTNGKKIVEAPIRVFIDNLGDNINTAYNEYGAVISADESVIVYTARKPGSTGDKIDPGLNENFEDIYIAYKGPDGNWTPNKNVGEPVNTSNHDANSGMSADGQSFIIYLGKSNGGDLFESVLNGEVWSKPESLGKKINTDFHESSACYSPDGRTIYFVSDQPEGSFGQHDIYSAQVDEKGVWGNVKNLGAEINTKYNEEAVYMHPDGKTLYFSSQGHMSIGGYDIFKSVLNVQTGKWSKPENLGYPVNTTDDDVFFVISANGRHGYYTSMMKD